MFLSWFPANYFKYSLSLQIETSNFRGGGEEPKPLQVMCEYPNPIEKYAKRFCTNTVIKDEMRNFYPVTSIRDFETPNQKQMWNTLKGKPPFQKSIKNQSTLSIQIVIFINFWFMPFNRVTHMKSKNIWLQGVSVKSGVTLTLFI